MAMLKVNPNVIRRAYDARYQARAVAPSAGDEPNPAAQLTTVIIEDAEFTSLAVALRPMVLTAAAADEMERLLNDPGVPGQVGQTLPTVSAEELLRHLRQ